MDIIDNLFYSIYYKLLFDYLFQNYLVTKMNSNKNNIYALLKRCQIKTSSYLRIIEKRRGKRSKYRIKLLDNAQLGINRGLLLVGRSLYTNTKKAPRQFKALFGAELQSWSFGKHSLKEKYKETHSLAKRYAPRSWFFKNKSKTYLQKHITNNSKLKIEKKF